MEKVCQNCGNKSDGLFTLEAANFRKNILSVEGGLIEIYQLCKECYEKRNGHLKEIVDSAHDKKLIVAGPGTGKTFTFREILKTIPPDGSSIVFTLINNLVDDLKEELSSLGNENIKVTTFHGFCRDMLHNKISLDDIKKDFEYFPDLPLLIAEDSRFIGHDYNVEDFHREFAHLNEGSDIMEFYLLRASYYNAASHDDSVYRVFSYYRDNQERMPRYEIVIADEYQDFNILEANFIKMLGEVNNILIAGDDDQSLYSFRHASNRFIRELYQSSEYERFSLPYCSRCTPVLVESTNRVIEEAQKLGLLDGRIERDFRCYWPDKFHEHEQYPKIFSISCSKMETVFKCIESIILDLYENDEDVKVKNELPILIIGPETAYQLNRLYEYLTSNLDEELFDIEYKSRKEQVLINDGYKMIDQGINDNLGWRIILHNDPIDNLPEIIEETHHRDIRILKLLPSDYVDKHINQLNELKEQVANEKELSKEQNLSGPDSLEGRVKIKLVTFYGSKGLSSLHTIVIGLNNGIFPKDPENITDDEICKFIVALTRSKKSCALISNGEYNKDKRKTVNVPSAFIGMIPKSYKQFLRYRTTKGKLVKDN